MHTHMHMHTHTHTYTHIHTHTHTYTHIHAHLHAHTHIVKHARTHTHIIRHMPPMLHSYMYKTHLGTLTWRQDFAYNKRNKMSRTGGWTPHLTSRVRRAHFFFKFFQRAIHKWEDRSVFCSYPQMGVSYNGRYSQKVKHASGYPFM